MEELKTDAIEKETRIAHLEEQVSGFALSLEKAHEEAISAFKKIDEYKNRLDSHYAAGFEDFRADVKEAFPDLNFDSFKLPLATESSLLQTSFEDVNVVDDANNEVTQDDPKSGGNAPQWFTQMRLFISLILLNVLVVLGFAFFFFFFF